MSSGNSIRMAFEPVALLCEVASAMYPDVRCRVEWVEGMAESPTEGPFGQTYWPDDGGEPTVSIDAQTPIKHAIEVLGHELAHVIAGYEAGHGDDWQRIFANLHEAYCARVEAMEQN